MKSSAIILLIILFTTTTSVNAQKNYSELWGKNGEKWDKTKLPDFTTAGYREGAVTIPIYPKKVSVIDFGAVNNGVTDNTAAFRKAIQKCGNKETLYIPAGKYVLSDSLVIEKSELCIKGDGPEKTILLFRKGLEELYPKFKIQTPWSWSGGMITFRGNISDIGIQDLSIRFPNDSLYKGHDFHERAYNGIGFSNGATNGWIKNVIFRNCDVGVWIEATASHITAEDWMLTFGAKRAAQDISAHHGLNIYGGYNLFQNFEINGRYVHDISVESETSVYNVFHNGKGIDICIDHHNHAQSKNLFTNINAGRGTRIYHSGGKTPPLGICFNEVFWGITADQYMPYCDAWNDSRGQAANNIQVGIKTKLPSNLNAPNGNWFESIDPVKLYPLDLYEAQMKLVKH